MCIPHRVQLLIHTTQEPITESYVQSDEADMGFTYPELTILGMSAIRFCCSLIRNAQIYQREIIGRLRKVNRLGPFGST